MAIDEGEGHGAEMISCSRCGYRHRDDRRDCPCCCGECGAELDSEGHCPSYHDSWKSPTGDELAS